MSSAPLHLRLHDDEIQHIGSERLHHAVLHPAAETQQHDEHERSLTRARAMAHSLLLAS